MKKKPTQRNIMRELAIKHHHNPHAIIREYAKAEQNGLASRNSNIRALSAEEYAKRLYADGIKKGWIPKQSFDRKNRPSSFRKASQTLIIKITEIR